MIALTVDFGDSVLVEDGRGSTIDEGWIAFSPSGSTSIWLASSFARSVRSERITRSS